MLLTGETSLSFMVDTRTGRGTGRVSGTVLSATPVCQAENGGLTLAARLGEERKRLSLRAVRTRCIPRFFGRPHPLHLGRGLQVGLAVSKTCYHFLSAFWFSLVGFSRIHLWRTLKRFLPQPTRCRGDPT